MSHIECFLLSVVLNCLAIRKEYFWKTKWFQQSITRACIAKIDSTNHPFGRVDIYILAIARVKNLVLEILISDFYRLFFRGICHIITFVNRHNFRWTYEVQFSETKIYKIARCKWTFLHKVVLFEIFTINVTHISVLEKIVSN